MLCTPDSDTAPAATSETAMSLSADSSRLPQGNGPNHMDTTAQEGSTQGLESSPRAYRFPGNAPIGYPISGNELIVARSSVYIDSDDSSVRTHSLSGDDEYFEIVPDGQPGELFVGGKQLAAGYHNRPEETAKRFLSRSCLLRAHDYLGAVPLSVSAGGVRAVTVEGGSVAHPHGAPSSSSSSSGEAPLSDATASSGQPSTQSLTSQCRAAGGTHRIPGSTDRVFRTGDIVVRIPKGIDSPGSGPGSSSAAEYVRGYSGSEWAGALVWLGRSDLQVLPRMLILTELLLYFSVVLFMLSEERPVTNVCDAFSL